MKFYYLEPEVAGGFGDDTIIDHSVSPPRLEQLHHEFEAWLGDVHEEFSHLGGFSIFKKSKQQ